MYYFLLVVTVKRFFSFKKANTKFEFRSKRKGSLSMNNLKLKLISGKSAIYLRIFYKITTTSIFIIRFKLFLKRFIRKPERSLKEFWLAAGSPNRITLKSKGSRMGKGKGKKVIRVLHFYPRQAIIGVSNLRIGKARFTLTHVAGRLSTNCFIYINSDSNPSITRRRVNYIGSEDIRRAVHQHLIETR